MPEQLTQEEWNEAKKTGPEVTKFDQLEERIDETLRIAHALGLTDEQVTEAKQEEADRQLGLDVKAMKIMSDEAKREPDPYAKPMMGIDVPKRPKRELALDERQFIEKDFQKLYDTWFLKNRHLFSTSVLVELKSTNGDRLYYKQIESHQHDSLIACTTDRGVYHRIESNPNKFQSKKPSDSFFIRNGKGYLAVMFFQKKRGQRTFWMVPYPSIVAEMERGSKSLSVEDCSRLGKPCEVELS